jgi:hypothetical protein
MVPYFPLNCNWTEASQVYKAFDTVWGGPSLSDAWHLQQVSYSIPVLSADVVVDIIHEGKVPKPTGLKFKQSNAGNDAVFAVVLSYTNDLDEGFQGPIIFSDCSSPSNPQQLCNSSVVYLDFGGPMQYRYWQIVFMTSTPSSLTIFEVQFDADCHEVSLMVSFTFVAVLHA